MAHITNALENLFNGIDAHQAGYSKILEKQDYSPAQSVKAKFFLNSFCDSKFMLFVVCSLHLKPKTDDTIFIDWIDVTVAS